MNLLNGVNPEKDTREMLDELRRSQVRLFTFPFDQLLKRKMTVYQIDDDTARVVVKGAPEEIIKIPGDKKMTMQ